MARAETFAPGALAGAQQGAPAQLVGRYVDDEAAVGAPARPALRTGRWSRASWPSH